jgi:parallel beta-helix repeat protein
LCILYEDIEYFINNFRLCIHSASDQTKAIFRQCDVNFSTAEGIWAGGTASASIEDSEIHRNGSVGIVVQESACVHIVSNRVDDNKVGIAIGDSARPFIVGNQLSGNQLAAVHTFDRADPVLERNNILLGSHIGALICDSSRGLWRHNRFLDGHAIGFELHNDCDPILEQNLIRGQSYAAVCRHSSRGILHENEIFDISVVGIELLNSSSPLLTHNLFDCPLPVRGAEGSKAEIREGNIFAPSDLSGR